MYILPALDLFNQQVVRLKQGRFDDVTVYSTDISAMAGQWIEQGAERLHLVDLNGAFQGKPCHFKEITEIRRRYPSVQIEVGGGIRDRATVERYFEAGVQFCILGSAAISHPEFLRDVCHCYPRQIILGVDAKDGLVAVDGWEKQSRTTALELIRGFSDCQLESVIYTDIARDGMLSSMNFDQIAVMASCGLPIIASGGLTSLDDIRQLLTMNNIHGVIAGKAIYEGRFTVAEAIAVSKSC